MDKLIVGRGRPEKRGPGGLKLLKADLAAVLKADDVRPAAVAGWYRDATGHHLIVNDAAAEDFRQQLTTERLGAQPSAPRPAVRVVPAEGALEALERLAKQDAQATGRTFHQAYAAVLRTPVGRGLWQESRR